MISGLVKRGRSQNFGLTGAEKLRKINKNRKAADWNGSMHYIRFLTEHPAFRRIVMQSFQDCDEEYRVLRGQMSIKTYEVVSRYCEEVQMPPDVRKRKTFIVRAIIYSAALFFDNGELEYNEKNMEQVRGLLEREFDLP